MFERMLERIWDSRNRKTILFISAAAVLAIAAVDWWTKPYFSLGFLYLFPIMLAAGFLPRWAIIILGIGCALLSERFSNLDPSDSTVRLTFETLALCGCGLFTSEVLRNRRLSISSQERLRVLVETSPAAIVTIDDRGFIELANRAAIELMAPRDGHLLGYPIAAFLPELHHALRWEDRPQFRTSMQCRGHRGNGETFLADVWFSTYKDGSTPRLAAIIADVSEEQSAPGSAADPANQLVSSHIESFKPSSDHLQPHHPDSNRLDSNQPDSNRLDSSKYDSSHPDSNRPDSTRFDPNRFDSDNAGSNNHQQRTPLSNRELDALRFVVQGLANKEIASQMEISESAVKNTLQQLFAKTEVRTRGQLVRVALERYRDLL
ncbi:MAG TPA: LuxR C-terminal-related transcriptional regulator [Terriglobales bacterium]|nr:LuxR C-terminal-related transcriptional regulator [Terriglobales bacterium]